MYANLKVAATIAKGAETSIPGVKLGGTITLDCYATEVVLNGHEILITVDLTEDEGEQKTGQTIRYARTSLEQLTIRADF